MYPFYKYLSQYKTIFIISLKPLLSCLKIVKEVISVVVIFWVKSITLLTESKYQRNLICTVTP